MSLTLLTLENKVLRKLAFSDKDWIGADKDVVMIMQRNLGETGFLKTLSLRVRVRNVRRVKNHLLFFCFHVHGEVKFKLICFRRKEQ